MHHSLTFGEVMVCPDSAPASVASSCCIASRSGWGCDLCWRTPCASSSGTTATRSASRFLAWLYALVLGLGRIETARVLQHSGVFQYLTGLPVYPDPQTLRRFLIRFGQRGLERFLRVHDQLRHQLGRRGGR